MTGQNYLNKINEDKMREGRRSKSINQVHKKNDMPQTTEEDEESIDQSKTNRKDERKKN